MTATSTRYFYSFVLGAMTSTATFAQSEAPSGTGAAAAEPVQEVVVTGIRHSIEQALDIKRESINVVDSIAMEDLGKLPDQNVAE
jgi:iron complex outermembrane receptor protein